MQFAYEIARLVNRVLFIRYYSSGGNRRVIRQFFSPFSLSLWLVRDKRACDSERRIATQLLNRWDNIESAAITGDLRVYAPDEKAMRPNIPWIIIPSSHNLRSPNYSRMACITEVNIFANFSINFLFMVNAGIAITGILHLSGGSLSALFCIETPEDIPLIV